MPVSRGTRVTSDSFWRWWSRKALHERTEYNMLVRRRVVVPQHLDKKITCMKRFDTLTALIWQVAKKQIWSEMVVPRVKQKQGPVIVSERL